ncbi:hypothetical protein BDN70DRAFT_901764 [Pholiota conissans]|uniref:Uncharacterized protein n=1 Tax=Pholiota conissans TaxID=109636 RepID=A0A9P5YKD0_9AGAR|nr:hypothetical protein BDN70DRAFT_901764 [Pholiota conissans]
MPVTLYYIMKRLLGTLFNFKFNMALGPLTEDIQPSENIKGPATGGRASNSKSNRDIPESGAVGGSDGTTRSNKRDKRHTANETPSCMTGERTRTTDSPTSNFDNIEAFKTITMMLGMLPHSTTIDVRDNLKASKGFAIKDPADRKETRSLCAFAQLAAGEYDATSLATNRITSDGTELRIIACTDSFQMKRSSAGTVDPWYLKFSKNWRRQTKENPVSSPEIHKPSPPEDAEDLSGLQYMAQLNESWKRPTLSQHLWILSDALIVPSGHHVLTYHSDLLPTLSRYTAAISYRKIARWFGNESLSLPYWKALEKVLPTHVPMFQPTVIPVPRLSDEENSDLRFLLDFVLLYANSAEQEDGYVIELAAEFPKLIEMAVDARMKPPQHSCEIYTNETRAEFHSLLLELLKVFDTTLKALTAVEEEVANSTENGARQFKDNVRKVDLLGYALLRISRGRAFRMHLHNIGGLLFPHDPRQFGEAASTDGGVAFPAHHQPIRKSSSESESVEAVMLLSQSYVDWLQAMLRHSRAVELLFAYITSRHFSYKSISLSILDVPRTSNTFLPWSRLFWGNAFIPAVNEASPNNEAILKFLQNGSKADKEAQNAESLLARLRGNPTVGNLKRVMGITYLNIGSTARTILSKIDESSQISDSIRAEIVALSDFFVKLPRKEQFFRNLNNKTVFEGTIHCEASLATILPAFTEQLTPEERQSHYKDINVLVDMQGFGHVIGTSDLSCPSCALFLRTLASMSDSPSEFIIQGNHSAISECSLPPWTPDRFVRTMNATLGSVLRQALVALMEQEGHEMTIEHQL